MAILIDPDLTQILVIFLNLNSHPLVKILKLILIPLNVPPLLLKKNMYHVTPSSYPPAVNATSIHPLTKH